MTKSKSSQTTLLKGKAPFELKGERILLKSHGKYKKKRIKIPTNKILTATKGDQISLLPKQKYTQITIEERIEQVKEIGS